jgi:hypothetical protein
MRADTEALEGSGPMILVGLIIIVAVLMVLMMRRSRGKLLQRLVDPLPAARLVMHGPHDAGT